MTGKVVCELKPENKVAEVKKWGRGYSVVFQNGEVIPFKVAEKIMDLKQETPDQPPEPEAA